jgi:hypothetical protein
LATIADKLSAIIGQKSDMVKNLNIKGVSSASDSEKFNTLVAKVLTVGGKNQYVKPGTGNTSSPTLNQKLGALYSQKNLLATYLTSMGVPASTSEKMNTLVPKILEIPMVSFYLYLKPLAASNKLYKGNVAFSSTYSDITITNITDLFTYAAQTNEEYIITDSPNPFVKYIDTLSLPTYTFYAKDGTSYKLYDSLVGFSFQKYIGALVTRSSLSSRYNLGYLNFPEKKKCISSEFIDLSRCLAYCNFPNVSQVNSKAFYDCEYLRSIYSSTLYTRTLSYEYTGSVPTYIAVGEVYTERHIKGINTLSESAFYACMRLEAIVLDEDISVFEKDVFNGCNSMSYVINSGDTGSSITTNYYVSNHVINLPNITSIYESAFCYCSLMFGYFNTPRLTTLSSNAFNGCHRLRGVNISQVNRINERAFMQCTAIKQFGNSVDIGTIHIPNCSVIDSEAFAIIPLSANMFSYDRHDSTDWIIPMESNISNTIDTVKSLYAPTCISIGAGAFKKHFGLSNITIPNVEYIGSYAFEQDTVIDKKYFGSVYFSANPITSINIPNVSYIGFKAFYGCWLNKSFNIGSCKSIGPYAFKTSSSATYNGPSISISIWGGMSLPSGLFEGQPINGIHYTGQVPDVINGGALNTYSGLLEYNHFSVITSMQINAIKLNSNFSKDIHFTRLTTAYGNVNMFGCTTILACNVRNGLDCNVFFYKLTYTSAYGIANICNALFKSVLTSTKVIHMASDISYDATQVIESYRSRIIRF